MVSKSAVRGILSTSLTIVRQNGVRNCEKLTIIIFGCFIPHGFLTLILKERKVEGMSINFAVHSPNVLHLCIGTEEVIENELVPLSVFVVFCR